jgi:hypothetical protein
MKSKVYNISDEDFVDLIDTSTSYSEVLRYFGLSTNGGCSSKPLKNRIEELNLDVSHFKGSSKDSQTRYTLEEILVENSPYQNRTSLKSRLLKEGILINECYSCGIDSWLDKPLSLQLDHKNGKNNDNTVDNLRLLCPNCHSQTETYAGKNKVK